MDHNNEFILNNQVRSQGGKKAARNMTPQQRKERAIKASNSRKCNNGIPNATHVGELKIGDIEIACAVLDDGERVILRQHMFAILGKTPGGRIYKEKPVAILELEEDGKGEVPDFIAISSLKPFITESLRKEGAPITFLHPKFGKSVGYRATLIPKICDLYLAARENNLLQKNQMLIAKRAEIIVRALANVAIITLVDEVTNYQRDREHDELQRLFSVFIAKEIQPWVKRFPSEFFDNLKKMYGLEHLKGNPRFAGHIINKYIYNELSPEIHEELKRRNPINENGYRNSRHHQLLTLDIGCPALEKQIIKVNTLMSVSDNKEQFASLYEKTKE